MVIKTKSKNKKSFDGTGGKDENKIIGQFVLYTKLSSIAKIIAYDNASDSYTIECNGRIINTIDEFLMFDFVNKNIKTIELEIYNKELKKERDEWKNYADSLEKERYELIKNSGSYAKDYNYYVLAAKLDKKRYESELKSIKHKKKDTSMVRKNKNAYMMFCVDQRPLIKEKYPELKSMEILAILGEKWKCLRLDGDHTFILRELKKERDKWNNYADALNIAENDSEYIDESVENGKYPADPYTFL